MTDKRAINTREKILRAASQLTLERGIGQLTLEATAAAAGISKGGLLHHFNTKEALIKGMIDYYLGRFEARLEEELTQCNSWIEAFIHTTIDSDAVEDQMSVSLLAAVVLNPDLLDPLREHYQMWQEKINEIDGEKVSHTAIRLILDGLWVSNLLALAPLSSEKVEQLREYLLTMAGE